MYLKLIKSSYSTQRASSVKKSEGDNNIQTLLTITIVFTFIPNVSFGGIADGGKQLNEIAELIFAIPAVFFFLLWLKQKRAGKAVSRWLTYYPIIGILVIYFLGALTNNDGDVKGTVIDWGAIHIVLLLIMTIADKLFPNILSRKK